MTPTLHFGSEIASDLRDASQSCRFNADILLSLQDLLDALREQPPKDYRMLNSTAMVLSKFYGRAANEIPLDLLMEDREEFRDYLRDCRYKKNSVRSYSNYLNILLSLAKDLGWQPAPHATPALWVTLLDKAKTYKKDSRCEKLIHHLAKQNLNPSNVREEDLAEWSAVEAKKGASFAKTQQRVAAMRKILVGEGYTSNLNTNRVRKAEYGIPLKEFPEMLCAEVQEVLRWKQDKYVPSRPKGGQIRAITAKRIEGGFCRLYGYCVNIEELGNISNLRELVTEQNVGNFISWSLNSRNAKGLGLSIHLGGLSAALSQNPKFSDITSPWMPKLLESIPEDSGEETQRRKEEKYLPYSVLCDIVPSIRRERERIPENHRKAIAVNVRDELVILWLLTLPWRQRNIRECRVGGRSPNLLHGPLPRMASITKPDWLLEAEEQNGPLEVWQFRFSPSETKTGNDIYCVLPERLIPLLEDYLNSHRPSLIGNNDPGTLFVSDRGKALTQATVRNIVSRLTLKHGGKIVTPHMFRDIFAYMWLELAPEDYLTLSKILWHRNIQTTIRIYGKRFNESTALARMERLLR